MGALAYYFGEHHKWARIRYATTADGVLLFASCVNAVGISYSGINAQAYAHLPPRRAPPTVWRPTRKRVRVPWILLRVMDVVACVCAARAISRYVSATTFMVLSNVNKFVVVGFGIVVLREASSWQAVVGVSMALLGGVWYARARAMASAK